MQRPIALLLSLFALSVCAGCEPSAADAPERPALTTTLAAVRVCAAGETVPGVDVSYWQQDVDWPRVAEHGIGFVIMRVAHGADFDTFFDRNWEGVRANGMVRGAYIFYEPLEDVVEQATVTVDAVGPLGPGDLPVTLDIEWSDGDPTLENIQLLANIVEEGTGKRPMIYTGKSYWNQYFTDEFANYDLWVPNWDVACPIIPEGWDDWLFWQTSGGGGTVPGINGGVDEDLFNGSLAELQFVANLPPHTTCSMHKALQCHRQGCGCADDVCSGGECPGSGCSTGQIAACDALGENCALGRCVPRDLCEGRPTCDDDEPCTTDICDPTVGCVFEPNSLPCDDGDPCTADDRCGEGTCQAGTPVAGCCQGDGDCPDGQTCSTEGRCESDPTVCTEPDCCESDGDCPGDQICSAGGRCQDPQACTERAFLGCEAGDVYWFDSCGNPQELATACDAAGCEAAACVGTAVTPDVSQPEPDVSQPAPDVSQPEPDAAQGADTSQPPAWDPSGDDGGSDGCAAGGSPGSGWLPWFLSLLALVGLGRRQRAPRSGGEAV